MVETPENSMESSHSAHANGMKWMNEFDNEKGKLRILTNKEIYASVKKPTIVETIRLNRLCWFGQVQRVEGNRNPKTVLYMNWKQQD